MKELSESNKGAQTVEIKQELNRIFGEKSKKTLNEMLVETGLDMVISIETLRRVLKGQKIRSETYENVLRVLKTQQVDQAYKAMGFTTCELVLKIVTANQNFYSIQRIKQSAEVRITFSLLNKTLWVSCIEDQVWYENNKKSIGDDYFKSHIKGARQHLRDHECDIFIIISHHVPKPKLIDDLESSLKIKSVYEFFEQYFDINAYKKVISERLFETDPAFKDEKSFLNIPVEKKKNDSSKNKSSLGKGNLREATKQFFNNNNNERLLILIGHHGSGKTVECLRLTEQLLQNNLVSKQIFPLPLYIPASNFYSSTPKGILGVINEEIERSYKSSLPMGVIEELIKEGHLFIIIDGIDESQKLHDLSDVKEFITQLPHLSSLDSRAKYLISVRHELFSSEEDVSITLDTFEYQMVTLNRCDATESLDLFKRKISPFWTDHYERLFPHLKDLILTPLFLNLISEMLRGLYDPQIKAESNSNEAKLLYSIFNEYNKAWATREEKRASPQRLPIFHDRILFTRLLASVSWDSINDNNKLDSESLIFVSSMLSGGRQFEGLKESSEFTRLLYYARLSSCLIRENNQYEFPSVPLRLYFIAENFRDELNNKESTFRTIKKRRIKRDEFKLLSLFYLGGIESSQRLSIEKIINNLIGILESTEVIECCNNFSEIRNIHFNVFGIILWITKQCGLKRDIFEIKSLYLPFIDQSDFGLDLEETNNKFTVNNGNFEFSVIDLLPISIRKTQLYSSLPETDDITSFEERKKVINEVKEYLPGIKVISEKNHDIGWVAVPRGVYYVPCWSPTNSDIYLNNQRTLGYGTELTGDYIPLITDSFLIMQHPVTNGQFLDFLKEKPEWSPQTYRSLVGNRWYLLGFNWLIEKFKYLKDWVTDPNNEFEFLWSCSPVVSVTWEAASAFASHHKCLLPSESQYEVAKRMFLKVNEKNKKQYAKLPWEGNKDRYFIHLDNEKPYPTYVPLFNCKIIDKNINNKYNLEMFESWAKEIHEDKSNIPLHLIGGTSEWMSCRWDPNWPIEIDHIKVQKDSISGTSKNIMISPNNDGVALFNNKKSRVYSQNSRTEISYVQRGGSYVTPKEGNDLLRSVQPKTNANEDLGFRCVKPIY